VVEQHGRSEAPPYFRALPLGWERPQAQELMGEGLGKIKDIASRALTNHRWRRHECVNLIPSEQTMSPLVRLLSVSDPVHRYAEHRQVRAMLDQEVFYYQGTDFISWAEQRLAAEMAEFLGCEQVETRPVSGQMANMTLFSALCAWRNRAYFKMEPERISLAITNHIGNGGHLSAQPMGALRDYIRKDPVTERFAVVNFPVMAENPYRIDLDELGKILDEYEPELIVFGKSMVIHKEPVAEVLKLLQERGQSPFIQYDMAHVLGLIGPHFQEPFKEGADFVTGSTHKTFFGTQRGVVGCSPAPDTPEWELWQTIQRRAFPGMTSNHHLGTLLGLLAAAVEMNTFKAEYQPQVIANAKALAGALKEAGVNVQGEAECGYTQTHQVLVEVGYAQGPQVARRLEDNNIICNYQALPQDEGFSASSGLRLGMQEMTRFGVKEADCPRLAGLIADCILKGRAVKDGVVEFRKEFDELQYCFKDDEVERLINELAAGL
jgi:aminomethyltransferase